MHGAHSLSLSHTHAHLHSALSLLVSKLSSYLGIVMHGALSLSLMVFSFLARKEDPLKPYLHSILPMLLACSSLSHPLRPCLEYWYNENFIKYNTASHTDSTKSNLLQTSQHGLGSS